MRRISEDLFQNAIDLNDTIIFEYDITQDVISFSDNVDKYIPLSKNMSAFVARLASHAKIHQDDFEKAITFFSASGNEDKARIAYIRFLDFCGEFRWYQMKGRMEKGNQPGQLKLYGTMTYMDDDAKHYHEEMSLTKDSLTKLLMKETLISSIDEYLKGIPKDVIPNVLMIDIDDFTEWQETSSQVSADGALIEVSRILKRAFRGSDFIARIDTDEFAVFMKGVRSTNILLERAAYVRQTIQEVFADIENSPGLTVSIGIAAMHSYDATAEKLMARGAEALQDAKLSGKNTYVLYTGEMERLDSNVNPILSSKEMELVRNILDPIFTWAYAVDDQYQLLYRNDVLEKRMNNECYGLCYMVNKGYGEPCPDCPIRKMDEKTDSVDCNCYSTSLRMSIPTRTTKITMRNGRNVYLVVSVRENIEDQINAVAQSEERIREALFTLQDIIWDVNITKNTCIRIKESNMKSLVDDRVENYQNLRNYYSEHIVHAEDQNAFYEATDPKYLKQAVRAGRMRICRDVRMQNVDGEYEWFSIHTIVTGEHSAQSSQGAKDEDFRVMIVCVNNNEQKKNSIQETETKIKFEIMRQKSDIMKDMALSFERHENVNEMIGILVYEYQVADKSYYLCSMFDELFQIDHNALVDEWSLLRSLKCHPDDAPVLEKYIERLKTSKQIEKTTVRLFNKFQKPIWYTIVIQTLLGLNNKPVRYLGTLQNVNAEMEIKAEMEYRADYDSITGLFNSETFYKKATEIIFLHEEQQFAIISIDIDKFRLINDRFGIEIGNRTLALLGKIIREINPPMAIGKRYQGDMFSVLLPYDEENDLLIYMTALSGRVRDDDSLPTSISLIYGIYKITDRNVPIRLMCDRARAVKKELKGNMITNYAVYDDILRLKLREQTEIEEEMERALENHEFEMFLQPQMDVKKRKLCGMEALVRWRHPVKGILVPMQFLSLFESNGFITKLDLYMWEEACKYLVSLKEREIDLPVSVNISRVHIGNTDLPNILHALVQKYDIEPRLLELEITENLFVDNITDLFEQMEELKKLGFKILMDDFGSGYSSLNMLRNAPVDTLKIDRFFLDEIMATQRGKIIVESSVRMARQLGLLTVAEGVETKEQLEFLDSIDCDIAQGYYFSRPIPIDEFEIFMKENL